MTCTPPVLASVETRTSRRQAGRPCLLPDSHADKNGRDQTHGTRQSTEYVYPTLFLKECVWVWVWVGYVCACMCVYLFGYCLYMCWFMAGTSGYGADGTLTCAHRRLAILRTSLAAPAVPTPTPPASKRPRIAVVGGRFLAFFCYFVSFWGGGGATAPTSKGSQETSSP